MAKQISKTAIGGFVLIAIALLVAGVMFFGSGKLLKKTNKYVLFFESSIKGLNVGAPVVFRGVKIGSVKNIKLQADPQTLDINIPIIIELEPDKVEVTGQRIRSIRENLDAMIERGLRAQLTLESLVTGQLMIEMDFHPQTPVRLVSKETEYLEIPTIPSAFEQLTQSIKNVPIEEIFKKMLSAVSGIEKVLTSPEMMDIVRTLDKTLHDADKLMINIDRQVEPLAASIRMAAEDAQRLLRSADNQIQQVSDKLQAALVSARDALEQAEKTLVTMDQFAGERSAFRNKLEVSLDEIAAASRSIRGLTEYLERHPEALLQGKSGS